MDQNHRKSVGADGGTRTRMSKAQGILSPRRLPFRHVRKLMTRPGTKSGAVRGTAKYPKNRTIPTFQACEFFKIPPMIPPNSLAGAREGYWIATRRASPKGVEMQAQECGWRIALWGSSTIAGNSGKLGTRKLNAWSDRPNCVPGNCDACSPPFFVGTGRSLSACSQPRLWLQLIPIV